MYITQPTDVLLTELYAWCRSLVRFPTIHRCLSTPSHPLASAAAQFQALDDEGVRRTALRRHGLSHSCSSVPIAAAREYSETGLSEWGFPSVARMGLSEIGVS